MGPTGVNNYLDDPSDCCERCEGIGLVADGQLTCPECNGGGCKTKEGIVK